MNFFRKLFNFVKIRNIRKKIKNLELRHANAPKKIQKRIDQVKRDWETAQNAKAEDVQKQCAPIDLKIKLLKNAISSPDLAGAVAELELIEKLQNLPDSHYVISDVKLRVDKAFRFDGEWLKTAQIDHVVLAPTGIFVIEVKNWSKKYVEEGDYFDPYQQVKRAGYLCYKMIGEEHGLKTHNIIAYKGHLPPKTDDSYIKVLPLNGVSNYIQKFKTNLATAEDVEAVASWFSWRNL